MDFEVENNQNSNRTLENAKKQWKAALGELQLQMTQATFDTWLKGSEVVSYEEGLFTVHVQHAYAVDWLQNRLLSVVQRTLQRHAGVSARVTFTAKSPEAAPNLVLVPEQAPDWGERGPVEGAGPVKKLAGAGRGKSRSLRPHYTFGTFVVGGSNRLAHAASLAVAENPAQAYNPLFIYGGVGLGKTHLLHALGNEAQLRDQSVLYVSSETFMNDLIEAIRTRKTAKFRATYRDTDVLLVDDIQFIAGKESTQEEFFHTFNTLHAAGKQIVVSCDRPPRALSALEDRLRSRFSWGLIADVQPPDFETRIAILQAKAAAVAAYPPTDVLEYIAHKVPSNIRELEGALNRVLAYAHLMVLPLALATARTALNGLTEKVTTVTPQDILSAVAEHFDLCEQDLTGRSRRKNVSNPRQLCMYLIREETDASLPQIGELLGGRDHTTIMHGCEKISAQMETDEQLRRDCLAIKGVLSQSTVA